MKKTVFVVLTLALVALVAAAGCISTPEEPASPVGVWLVPGQDVELLLTPDGSYWGTAQVNVFSGSYTVDGDKLTFSEPVSTLMAGPGLEEEQAFFAALMSVDSFKILNSKLVLYVGEDIGMVLVPSFVGTWEGDDGLSVTFNTDMTFSGHGPVNGFGGTYANTVERLVITPEYITEAIGSDEEMEAEAAFLNALTGAKDYTVEHGVLTLRDAVVPEIGNALLVLTVSDVGEFKNQYGDTIVFHADGTFSGQAPVNTFKGTYEVIENGKKIVLHDFSLTKMVGSEDDMRHEASFLEKLEAEDYTFTRGQMLVGYDEAGEVLHVFVRA
ncbi:MAG: META domain-containing protein [Methanocorpusculum sp.]|nr:META domain-containing protein [Methanocorpusculum sp.]